MYINFTSLTFDFQDVQINFEDIQLVNANEKVEVVD